MRTTVTINDALLAEAKLIAARENRTLGDVVEDGLRKLIQQGQGADGRSREWKLRTHGSGGLLPGVDLEDREAIAELLGDNEFDAPA
ncbi:MAG TPA: type II toxin-antitoxin system VapB family antitoxin [Pseudolysinimonas sp.]|nr:type II toxin-antitoxin system VapB family antitoxin [Pseudolysinimonas sp.]